MSSGSKQAELEAWVTAQIVCPPGGPRLHLAPLAGDASSRRYFRTEISGERYVVAYAPPETEKNEAFIDVRQQLAVAGVTVPEIVAVDLDRGYFILEDLGDRLLLPELATENVDSHYRRAGDVLLKMAAAEVNLPTYDESLLTEELERFPRWFLDELLDHAVGPEEVECLTKLWPLLIENALSQPRVLVHRDFHSRNLMLAGNGELAVIDFQDAVHGPVTYDLVSLLRDCYVRWPVEKVEKWALAHRDALVDAACIDYVDDEQFMRWFDWMGLQRHIKVLGTFARLYLRDGKAGYLSDLPLVLRYVREVAAAYAPEEAAFSAFSEWLEEELLPRVADQRWGASS